MGGRADSPASDRRAAAAAGPDPRKRHGRHYTPAPLAVFLAERVLEHVVPGERIRILDPACGDGELLTAVREVAARRFPGVRCDLVGYDLDPAAVRAARGREPDAQWHHGDFLGTATSLADCSFDAVITNPPYVRTQQLGAATSQLLRRQFGLRGRIDLTHPFVAVVPRLLRPDGVLGLLCANRFLTTRAGANLRAVLSGDLTPVELYDLGDTRLFEAAVLPAVTVAVRSGCPAVPGAGGRSHRSPCRYVSVYEVTDAESVCGTDLFAALLGAEDAVVRHNGRVVEVRVGVLHAGDIAPSRAAGSGPWAGDTAALGASEVGRRDARDAARPGGVESAPPWRLSQPEVDAWLRRIADGTWRTFGEVARIRVGIKTTADRVFISDRWAESRPRPEPELLFDLLTHHDLDPWRVRRERPRQVLYPYDVTRSRRTPIDLREFPGAAAYLAQHRAELGARRYLTESGREWFEIWVPQRPQLWRAPKLVFPDISVTPRFALDRSGAIVNGDCYWISLGDLPDVGAVDAGELACLLMAVANSALGLRFYDAVCGNRLYSGRRRWITQYVARLPIPDPAGPAARSLARWVRAAVEAGTGPDQVELDQRVAAAFRTAIR
ncbi:Eco57I restriction-modification methylase domain-containing protein [Nocardia stercoris]|uniref:site-specific DNA-methyltransferase (adenine-specific) n=1 Tax=Nocardia stercoris TaxID=2483361 RepID=A0A3M2KWX2_9NOCA|nr:N-6 DNA methylase [Nocardia stercoris]RMI29544.1 methyltransferase domain-containing protein [Nocardia stercoris]